MIVSFSAIGGIASEEEIVLLHSGDGSDLSRLESIGAEVLEVYPERILLRVDESVRRRLNDMGYRMDTLSHRTELNVKGHSFDMEEGMPEFPEELTIDSYEPGKEGLYIVHMLGPVHPEWRATIQEQGVDIVSYTPNYAYIVSMTTEISERVLELDFVDRVEIYQPGFKLSEDLNPGMISVTFGDGSQLVIDVEDEEELFDLARMEDVYYISQYSQPKLMDEIASQIIGGGCWIWDPEDDPYNPYRGEGDHGAYVNQLGYTGDGIVTTVADTGIGDGTIGEAGHLDFTGRVIGGYYWQGDTWADGHGHGTHVAGSLIGNTHDGSGTTIDEFGAIEQMGPYYAAQGLAFDSEVHAQKIFDDAGGWIGPSDYYEMPEEAKQNADSYIHSNSWGDTENMGSYTVSSEAFDGAVRDANRDTDHNEPIVIIAAAGNEGEDGITPPGTGKNVITVGSTENFNPDLGVDDPDNVSGFSSRGWTDDNRVKPDLMAPGGSVISTSRDGEDIYETRSGTSMATPAVAGAAAVVVEWYEDVYGQTPSPAMVKALMINTAYSLQGDSGDIPNVHEGWGMVNLPELIDPSVGFVRMDQNSLLTTGEVDEYEVEHADGSEPLKISLVWTDKEASTGDLWALKNNLNLEVIAPNGDTYRGNAFEGGWTPADTDTMDDFDTIGDGWDDVNNVQNVFIPSEELEEGEYTIRVIGELIPEDGNNDGDANQDYALVVQNAHEGNPPSITLERPDGGEHWFADTEEEIIWHTSEGDGEITTVDLDYSTDGGYTWDVIEYDLVDDGSYLWTVPDDPSFDCLVRATVYDDFGSSGTDVSDDTFTIFGTGQTHDVEITHPSDGDIFVEDEVTMLWEVDEGIISIEEHEVSSEGEHWETADEEGEHTFYGLQDGEVTLYVRVTDEYGYEVEDSVSIVVDTTPPVVDIISPQDDEIYVTDEVLLKWEATSHNTEIVVHEVSLDGEVWEEADSEEEHVFTVNDGMHTAHVRVEDEAGHVAEDSVSFIVDMTPPEIDILDPEEGDIFSYDQIDVEWEVTSHVTEVVVHEVSLDGEAWEKADSEEGHGFTGLEDGENTVHVRIEDEAGHGAEDSVSFIVDTTPPELEILFPDDGAVLDTREIDVEWNVTSHVTEVVVYEVSLDGETWEEADSEEGHGFTELEDGDHTVHVRVEDEAGHVTEKEVSFTVDIPLLSWIHIYILVFIVIVIALILMYMIKRKKGSKEGY